jgi:hypothetical protein
MTSVIGGAQRVVSLDNDFYMVMGDCRNKIYSLNTTAGTATFAPAQWASTSGAFISSALLVSTAGAGVLRDMGKSYVSSGRTFRKVQLVVPQNWATTISTFGVAGAAGTGAAGTDFFTGYIETDIAASTGVSGVLGTGSVAPVAKWGR